MDALFIVFLFIHFNNISKFVIIEVLQLIPNISTCFSISFFRHATSAGFVVVTANHVSTVQGPSMEVVMMMMGMIMMKMIMMMTMIMMSLEVMMKKCS